MSMGGGGIDIGTIVANLDVNSGRMVQGLAEGRRAMDAIQAEIRNLQDGLRGGSIGFAEYTARVSELRTVAADLTARMNAAYAAIGQTGNALDVFNAQARAGYGSTTQLSRGLMQLGYVVDDIRYGFSAVVNNIAPLVFAFTGNAGLAAAAQITAVVGYELYTKWNDLLNLFGAGKIKSEAEEMDELAKATKRTADEEERLYRFKQLNQKTDDLRHAKTKAEKESEDTATKAITEAGVRDVAAGVKKTAPERLDALVPRETREALDDARKRLASLRANPNEGGNFHGAMLRDAERKAMEAEKALNDAREEAARKVTSAATLTQLFPKGPGDLAALVRKNPAAFGPNSDALQEGLEQAQKEADTTPGERQRAKLDGAVGKWWGKFKQEFNKEVAKQVEKNKEEESRNLASYFDVENDRIAAEEEVARENRQKKDREQREFTRQQHEDAQQRREFRAHNLEAARVIEPEIETKVDETIARGLLAGKGRRGIKEDIRDILAGPNGMNEDDATTAAEDLLVEGGKRLEAKGGKRSDQGQDRQQRRDTAPSFSQVVGTSDEYKRVQASISDKEKERDEVPKRTNELVKESNRYLAQLAERKGLFIGVKG